MPVPTSQFKSYRRVMATDPCSTYSKHKEGAFGSKGDDTLVDLTSGHNSINPFGDHDARSATLYSVFVFFPVRWDLSK